MDVHVLQLSAAESHSLIWASYDKAVPDLICAEMSSWRLELSRLVSLAESYIGSLGSCLYGHLQALMQYRKYRSFLRP